MTDMTTIATRRYIALSAIASAYGTESRTSGHHVARWKAGQTTARRRTRKAVRASATPPAGIVTARNGATPVPAAIEDHDQADRDELAQQLEQRDPALAQLGLERDGQERLAEDHDHADARERRAEHERAPVARERRERDGDGDAREPERDADAEQVRHQRRAAVGRQHRVLAHGDRVQPRLGQAARRS